MQEKNVKFVALGCRLNIVEAEKIRNMLETAGADDAIVVNTCAVTQEAMRQSKQTVRKLARENPSAKLYVTGCAATHAPDDIAGIAGVARVVSNFNKMDIRAYLPDYVGDADGDRPISSFQNLSKGFVQIQNGCNHQCTYCLTRLVRGTSLSFPYDKILAEVRHLVKNGYAEIVLTGVDIAGYRTGDPFGGGVGPGDPQKTFGIADLCAALLRDVPEMRRLRLSSLDPATDMRPLVDLMARDTRMLPHLHLSMQSGSDAVLGRMGRRHTAAVVREWVKYAARVLPVGRSRPVSFSWDIICGFPGETPELFDETCDLIRELKPIRLHAFPFSPRVGTAAAAMPGRVDRSESKLRVKIVDDLARRNMREFMESKRGQIVQILTEENGTARDEDDIPVKIAGCVVPSRHIMDVMIDDVTDGTGQLSFVAHRIPQS